MMNAVILVSKHQIKTAVHVTVQKICTKLQRRKEFIPLIYKKDLEEKKSIVNRGIITCNFLVPFYT